MLEKSGTWISYKGERLGQGRENARQFLKENVDIRNKIEAELRKQLGLTASPAAAPAEAPEEKKEEKTATGDGHRAMAHAAGAAGAAKPRPTR